MDGRSGPVGKNRDRRKKARILREMENYTIGKITTLSLTWQKEVSPETDLHSSTWRWGEKTDKNRKQNSKKLIKVPEHRFSLILTHCCWGVFQICRKCYPLPTWSKAGNTVLVILLYKRGTVNAKMDSLSERLLLAVVICQSRFSLSTSAGRETTSVADPCHFGVDPDPRIHSSD